MSPEPASDPTSQQSLGTQRIDDDDDGQRNTGQAVRLMNPAEV